MCRSIILMAFAGLIVISTVSAEMQVGVSHAISDETNNDSLIVRNYEAGASLAEVYSDNQQLERYTEINTRMFGSGCQKCSSGKLEASINSNVIGQAHIVWQSIDTQQDRRGRRTLLGRNVESLVGVFSIQKFVQLWSNSKPGEVNVDWLPCS